MKKLLLFALVILLASCEKMVVAGDNENEQDPNGNVVLQFSTYSTGAFTRGATDVSDLCSRMNIGVFDDEGTSVKSFAQKSSDTSFGTASLSLAEGTYTVVAYGHNKENSVAANSLTDISFSGGPSDVFLYYGTIDVTEEPQTYNLSMNRVVGMFRLTLTDETIPDGVATLAVSISGGSIHLNPSTGCGGTNKTPQKTNIDVAAGQKVFEVYTFPQAGGITANITVVAKSADGTEIAKKVFSDVPIKANEITSYRGKMFDGVTTVTSSSMGFTADPEWGGTNEYEF